MEFNFGERYNQRKMKLDGCKITINVLEFSKYTFATFGSYFVDLILSNISRRVMAWKIVPTCLFWCLWRERNNQSFEDVEKTFEELLSSFYHTLYI